jgi:hypothetical protein
VIRIELQTAVRAGSVTLVDGYRTASSLNLGQLYRARPMQIKAPSVFVDSMSESAEPFPGTTDQYQRVIRVGIRVVWGVYDAGETVDQRDRFVDGFYAYVADRPRAFDGNADCVWIGTDDDEDWSPGWIPTDESKYFSTLVTLEGRAGT